MNEPSPAEAGEGFFITRHILPTRQAGIAHQFLSRLNASAQTPASVTSPVLERGGKNPTITTLKKLAIVLSCDISELLTPLPDDFDPPEPLRSGRRRSL